MIISVERGKLLKFKGLGEFWTRKPRRLRGNSRERMTGGTVGRGLGGEWERKLAQNRCRTVALPTLWDERGVSFHIVE